MGSRFLQVESRDKDARVKALQGIAEKRAASAPFEEMVAASPGSRLLLYHGNIYYRTYATKDGPIGVCVLSDPLRRRLLDTLGFTDVSVDPGYAPDSTEGREYASALTERAEAVFRQKTSGEWLALFEQQGIPAGSVRFIEELLDDPQVKANGLVVEVEHKTVGKVKTMGPLAEFSDTSMLTAAASPSLGQHTEEVLLELGYNKEEITRWQGLGIVGETRPITRHRLIALRPEPFGPVDFGLKQGGAYFRFPKNFPTTF